MIDCADSTTLRAHLDHTDPDLDAHLDECEDCRGLLHAVAEDAGYTARTLAVLADGAAADVDVEAALAGARSRIPAPVVPLPVGRFQPQPGRSRRLALAAAAVLVVVGVTVTPGGRSAVADVLDAFRGQRLQAVVVDMGKGVDALGPEDAAALAALGDLDLSGLDEPGRVPDLDTAAARSGLTAPSLAAAGGPPDRIIALAPGTVRFTLQRRDGNGVPAELDGAVLHVDVPGALAAIYGGGDDEGPPRLVVGRAGAVTARAEGAALEDIRSFVLSRQELPAELRAQLAAIDDWRSTIPVPVPLDSPGWLETEVAGRPALAFGDGTGIGAIVIRQDVDGLTVVGGRTTIDRVLGVAAGA